MSDYAAAMRQVVDEHTAEGPYVPRVAAAEIVEKLRANDPELLAGWLDEQAVHFLWQAINDRDRSVRAAAAQRAPRAAFRSAVETGGDEPLRAFLDVPYTVADGSRMPLARLTHEDLLFVADDYKARAARNAFREVFMRSLAARVKTGVVADHFTEEQVSAMWSSLM